MQPDTTQSGAATHSKECSSKIERLSFTTDAGAAERARLGLLVLESDQTVEWEFRTLTDIPGVSVYHARLANDVTVTPETLARMETELPVAARLLPDYLGLKAIAYGCTSGSTIIGEDRVARAIGSVHPGVPVTNPLSAAKAAFKALKIQRLALLTPYSPEVTDAMQARFSDAGINVIRVGSFYEESDLVVGKIDQKSILKGIIAIGNNPDIDGVFVSCTSLRAADIIEQAEETLGKPVTASNHAMAWHLLRLAEITDTPNGRGSLFRKQLAPHQ